MSILPTTVRLGAAIGFSLLLALLLGGCSEGPFGESKVRVLIEGGTLRLDGEQVMLTATQLDCGTQAELWEIEKLGPERYVGRLTQKARNMKFNDDIQIGDMKFPYAQVRGQFSVALVEMLGVRDEDPKTKVVDAKLGARFDHPCFAWLPIMGVRRGRFSQDVSPKLEFRLGNDWEFASIQH